MAAMAAMAAMTAMSAMAVSGCEHNKQASCGFAEEMRQPYEDNTEKKQSIYKENKKLLQEK